MVVSRTCRKSHSGNFRIWFGHANGWSKNKRKLHNIFKTSLFTSPNTPFERYIIRLFNDTAYIEHIATYKYRNSKIHDNSSKKSKSLHSLSSLHTFSVRNVFWSYTNVSSDHLGVHWLEFHPPNSCQGAVLRNKITVNRNKFI